MSKTAFAHEPQAAGLAAEALRIAALVTVTQGEAPAKALLDVPNALLGKAIKEGISQVLKKAFLLSELALPPQIKRKRMPPKAVVGQKGSGKTASLSYAKADGSINIDAFARAGAPGRERLVTGKQLLPTGEVMSRLAITRQAVNKAVTSKRFFVVEVGSEQYIPAFYASAEFDRRKLEAVTKLLGDLPGWSKWQFFTTAKGSLGGITPLEALTRGMVEPVKEAAEGFARS